MSQPYTVECPAQALKASPHHMNHLVTFYDPGGLGWPVSGDATTKAAATTPKDPPCTSSSSGPS